MNPLSLLVPSSSKGMGGIAGNIFKGGLNGMLANLKDSVYNSGGIIMGPGVGTTAAGTLWAAWHGCRRGLQPGGGHGRDDARHDGVQRLGVGGTIEAGREARLRISLARRSVARWSDGCRDRRGGRFPRRSGQLLLGESPAKKAHDDIKSIYGVDIPQNSGTIKQVVQIAQSQFGGDVAVAVRSPSVRQLVMLYSEATGQKMPLSATTPYAGSLVEQGGKLYQQASYQDGQAHVYASNIPTLGGIAREPIRRRETRTRRAAAARRTCR